jgi:hypothetical protein
MIGHHFGPTIEVLGRERNNSDIGRWRWHLHVGGIADISVVP